MKIKKSFILVSMVLASLFTFYLSSCLPASKPEIESSKDFDDNKVAIIGKVVLDPPIRDDEWSSQMFEHTKKLLIMNYKKEPHEQKKYFSPMGEDINLRHLSFSVPMGKTFYVNSEKKTFWIAGMTVVPRGYVQILMPARYKINIKKTDKVIYIGTFYYKFNELRKVIKTKFVDEYDSAKKDFARKFGLSKKIRKSLAEPF
ncbi:MAG: hypothetical protein OEZ36_08320 [Spirochaetota bacterium]|nr:hypothetical protein [Spirochaetota bacterium]